MEAAICAGGAKDGSGQRVQGDEGMRDCSWGCGDNGESWGCGGEGVQPGTPRGPRRGVRQCIPTGMHGRAWGLLRYGPCNPWGIRVDLDCFLKIIPLLLAPGAGGTNGIRY